MTRQVSKLFRSEDLGIRWATVQGGDRRQDSVRNGLAALPRDCDAVLVHDSARPFASATLVSSLIHALENGAQAAIPAIPVTDTVKRVSNDEVAETLNRDELRAVQTPQAFETGLLARAHEQAEAEGWEVTDDASMTERLAPVAVVAGEAANIKITNPDDLALLRRPTETIPCTGWGYDVHRYGGNRDFVLGGVPIRRARPASEPIPTATRFCTLWPTPSSAPLAAGTSVAIFRTRTTGSKTWTAACFCAKSCSWRKTPGCASCTRT